MGFRDGASSASAPCGHFGPTFGRCGSPKRVEELGDSFFVLHHDVVEHVDDIVLFVDAVLGDPDDGVVELLGIPDDLRDIILNVVHIFLVHRDNDIPPFFSCLPR